MQIEHLLAFNLALIAALISPGPAMLLSIRTTLTRGRAPGIATGCGLGLMAGIWTTLALFGLDGLFHLFPWAYGIVKTSGAVYLIYLAWKAWINAPRPVEPGPGIEINAFATGFLVNLLNPKSMLFAGAVLVVIFPPDLTVFQKGLIAGNQLLVEIAFYAGFALMMDTRSIRAGYIRTKAVFDRVSAIILAGLGLRLLYDR